MANPVDVMLRGSVTPLMRSAGFRKAGRRYRLTAGNGDLVILEFEVRSTLGVFAVDYVMVPLSHWDWVNRNDLGLPAPDVGAGVVRCDIAPPVQVAAQFSEGPTFSYRWIVDEADEGTRCAVALTAALKEQLPLMRRLLDRETVLREAGDPASEVHPLLPMDLLSLFLRIDAVDAAGLEKLLTAVDPTTPNLYALADWARVRVAARA
ncbi:hypothetical protein [Actinacidiphila guanduensis]|uniref:hypothetical protein n=1 Tax=Actinacidiphila guanduensis TaxID=310781 RepID=UPI00115F94A5|nr:hypothetical protein [Actinacidiphila guanduensis]